MEMTTAGPDAREIARAADVATGTETVPSLLSPRVEVARVAIVDNLLNDESDLSDVAWSTPGFDATTWLKRDPYIASLAIPNIENNVKNLIERPEFRVFHLSEVSDESIAAYDPDAVVLSGTLRDFDFYNPE